MDSFRMYESSFKNILDELGGKGYIIEDGEIQEVIDRLYSLVDVDEDYIDGAITAIEKLCDNNEEFKKEWFGALDEVESEVLEEGKMGKLASIALLALSMGISLTGCDVEPQIPMDTPSIEEPMARNDVEDEEPIDSDREEDIGDKEENDMEEEKPTYDEIKDRIRWFNSRVLCIRLVGEEDNRDALQEIVLSEEERNDVDAECKIPKVLYPYGVWDIEYSIDGGERHKLDLRNLPYTF